MAPAINDDATMHGAPLAGSSSDHQHEAEALQLTGNFKIAQLPNQTFDHVHKNALLALCEYARILQHILVQDAIAILIPPTGTAMREGPPGANDSMPAEDERLRGLRLNEHQ